MTTRSGIRYHLRNLESIHSMDFDLLTAFKKITKKLNTISGSIESLNTKVGPLEEGRSGGITEPVRMTPPLEAYPRD